jgi:hypothetical protein
LWGFFCHACLVSTVALSVVAADLLRVAAALVLWICLC